MKDSRHLSALLMWQSLFLKNKAGDWRKEGFGVLGWFILERSNFCVFCGIGVDGKNPFFTPPTLRGGVLAAGDANEKDLAFKGEMSAGPSRDDDGAVGPTLDADVSVNERYQGLTESKW